MDTASHPDLVVERNIVLHGLEVGQAQSEHFLTLPVLLEPAAIVAVDGQIDPQEARDRGLLNSERFPGDGIRHERS